MGFIYGLERKQSPCGFLNATLGSGWLNGTKGELWRWPVAGWRQSWSRCI